MKKIDLTDGMSKSISRKEQGSKVIELLEKIKSECKQSGLSYVDTNKALYLADKELYQEKINS